MNNKGIINWFVLVIMFFVIALVFLTVQLFFNNAANELEEVFVGTPTALNIISSGRDAIGVFDPGFGILFFISGIVIVLGGSSVLATNKIFIPIFLIIFFILVILSAQFSNAYGEIILVGDELAEVATNNYPIMTFIFSKLPFFVGIIGLGIFTMAYAKTRGQQSISI